MKKNAVETHFMIEISTMKGFLNLWHLQYLWTVMDIWCQYVSAVLNIHTISSHSAVFYWKSTNLIGYLIAIYSLLYDKPSYSCILIGSRLRSFRRQPHDWRHHLKFFFLCFERAEKFESLDNILRDWEKDKIQKVLYKTVQLRPCRGIEQGTAKWNLFIK